jgi:Mg2+ and Co2+ transporter CorA
VTSALVYRSETVTEYDDLEEARAAQGTTWVRVHDGDAAERRAVAEVFGIHSLAVEDVEKDVRPKTEEFAAYTFALVKTAELTRGETTFDEEVVERSRMTAVTLTAIKPIIKRSTRRPSSPPKFGAKISYVQRRALRSCPILSVILPGSEKSVTPATRGW